VEIRIGPGDNIDRSLQQNMTIDDINGAKLGIRGFKVQMFMKPNMQLSKFFRKTLKTPNGNYNQ
jgi:hypothetical protein